MNRRQHGQALVILLFGSLFVGGAGMAAGLFLTGRTTTELRKETLAIVQEEDRRKAIEAVFTRWDKEVKSIDAAWGKNRKALVALLERHDASASDFDTLYAQADAIEAQGLGMALDMRYALREQLSADEWRRLFSVPGDRG